MKKLLPFFLFIGSLVWAQHNTGIGTTNPDASAQLDISAADKGVLFPRVALTAKNTATPISAPAIGLKVYNTATAGISPYNVTPGFYFWDGTQWVRETNENDNTARELVMKNDEVEPTKIGYTLRATRDYAGVAKDGITGKFGIKRIGNGSIDLITERGLDYFNVNFEEGDVGVFGDNSMAWGTNHKITGNYSTTWGFENIVGGNYNTVWGGMRMFPQDSRSGEGGTRKLIGGISGNGWSNVVYGFSNTVWGLTNNTSENASYNTVGGSGNVLGNNSQHNFVLGESNNLNGNNNRNFILGSFNEISNITTESNYINFIFGQGVILKNTSHSTILGNNPTIDSFQDNRLLNIGNGNGGPRSDAFMILKNGRVGISIDDFQNTSSEAKLQVNGKVLVGDFGDNSTNNNIINAAGSNKATLDVRGTAAIQTLDEGNATDRIIVADSQGILKLKPADDAPTVTSLDCATKYTTNVKVFNQNSALYGNSSANSTIGDIAFTTDSYNSTLFTAKVFLSYNLPYTGGNGAYFKGSVSQPTADGFYYQIEPVTLANNTEGVLKIIIFKNNFTPLNIGVYDIPVSFGGQTCTIKIEIIQQPMMTP